MLTIQFFYVILHRKRLNTMEKLEIYEEVRCDYYDPEGFWCVDAWYPNKEEGIVIAVINDFGGVYAINDLDTKAKEIISEKVKEIKENYQA